MVFCDLQKSLVDRRKPPVPGSTLKDKFFALDKRLLHVYSTACVPPRSFLLPLASNLQSKSRNWRILSETVE